jgi:hypothetical protein
MGYAGAMSSKPPPDRGKDPKRQPAQPLNVVRGGSVCDPGQKGGHIMKGSMKAAVCMPTVGSDPRPRYREAGKPVTPPSRHSVQWAQHRKGGKRLA